jgi:hypothetical protein
MILTADDRPEMVHLQYGWQGDSVQHKRLTLMLTLRVQHPPKVKDDLHRLV